MWATLSDALSIATASVEVTTNNQSTANRFTNSPSTDSLFINNRSIDNRSTVAVTVVGVAVTRRQAMIEKTG